MGRGLGGQLSWEGAGEGRKGGGLVCGGAPKGHSRGPAGGEQEEAEGQGGRAPWGQQEEKARAGGL